MVVVVLKKKEMEIAKQLLKVILNKKCYDRIDQANDIHLELDVPRRGMSRGGNK